jgi:purine nucleosidase/pyrimidine-specific ribonucleoside hydrolase
MAIAHLMDDTRLTTERLRVIVERESRLSLGQTIVERRENFAWDGLAEIVAASDADFEWIADRLVAAAGAAPR